MNNESGKIKLSVVVPVYNVEMYLPRCLDSILFQTYYVDEIICVDDGSTDGSLAILREYAQKDNRIKIIHKENGGLVSARKVGADAAKGEYITCVDSDDWVEHDMYQDMMENMLQTDADFVTSGCIRDYGDHCVEDYEKITPGLYEGTRLLEEIQSNMISIDKFYASNISVHIVGKVFKSDFYKKYQALVDDAICSGEDAAVSYPCILNAKKISVIGKNYYHYCMRNNSISGVVNNNEDARIEALLKHLECAFREKQNSIKNVMEQFLFLKCYYNLMRRPDKIIEYKDGILFPYGVMRPTDKIVIYGRGRVGIMLKQWLDEHGCFELVAWIDKAQNSEREIKEILQSQNYDKVLVAVAVNNVVENIKEELIALNVDKKKIYDIDCNLIIRYGK